MVQLTLSAKLADCIFCGTTRSFFTQSANLADKAYALLNLSNLLTNPAGTRLVHIRAEDVAGHRGIKLQRTKGWALFPDPLDLTLKEARAKERPSRYVSLATGGGLYERGRSGKRQQALHLPADAPAEHAERWHQGWG